MSIATGGLGDEAFGHALEEHRRDIVLLAYRYLGSLTDAEEAAQETALRAWRARRTFRGESSLRTWLHRIAIRVCVDLAAARRRVLPMSLGPATSAADTPDLGPNEISWLQPLPNELIADASTEPDARYSLRESVSLAFLVALQALPPRQRAVLLLRDVLALFLSAAEAASTLEISVAAANSALARARVTLRSGAHEANGQPGYRFVSVAGPVPRVLGRMVVEADERGIGSIVVFMGSVE